MHEFLGFPCGFADGFEVAGALNAETRHGLAGFGDFINDVVGPFGFDADHDHSSHVGIAAITDQGVEGQVQVFAKLQAAVRVRQRHRAADQAGDTRDSGVGDVIHRHNQNVVANAHAVVIAPVAGEGDIWKSHFKLLFFHQVDGAGGPSQAFDVMGVHVRTLDNVDAGVTDGAPVLDHVFFRFHSAHGNFMAQGYILGQGNFGDGLPFQGDGQHHFARLQVHGGHANIVGGLV